MNEEISVFIFLAFMLGACIAFLVAIIKAK